MNISEHDKIEVSRISEIVLEIDHIDVEYVNSITDEINQYQPFLLSMLLGYQLDFKPEEFEEISRIVFMIWEYFREANNVKNKKMTEESFEKLEKRNIGLLKYLEGESDPVEKLTITSSDLGHLKSKALLTGIFYRFDTRSPLLNMNPKTKGILLIGMRSLIECFEEIEK